MEIDLTYSYVWLVYSRFGKRGYESDYFSQDVADNGKSTYKDNVWCWQQRQGKNNFTNFLIVLKKQNAYVCIKCQLSVEATFSKKWVGIGFMVFNSTFNNISVISWGSVLFAEETGVPGENHRPALSHWSTLSHNAVSSTPCHGIWTHNVSGDRHGLHR